MKELAIVALVAVLAMLSASSLHAVRKLIVEYEYRAYIERVESNRGFNGWH